VPTRQDEPGAKQWRQTEDAKDLLREPGVPVRELSGYRQGCAELNKALRLAASPETPGNVTALRSALRHALGLFPQSGRDQLSWSIAGGLGRWGGGRLEVCGRRTCGRCLPLKAAAERERCWSMKAGVPIAYAASNGSAPARYSVTSAWTNFTPSTSEWAQTARSCWVAARSMPVTRAP